MNPLAAAAAGLARVAVSLWVGGMWVVGYMVAPVLFATLPTRILAGHVAGKMFAWMAWIGLACAAWLLLYLAIRLKAGLPGSRLFWLVVAMALLVSAGHFGVTPVMEALKAEAWPREAMEAVTRDRFATWHGVASVLYLIQSVLGLLLVVEARRLP